MRTFRHWFAAATLASAVLASAKNPADKFQIHAGRSLSGNETYELEKTNEGYRLNSRIELWSGQTPLTSTQEQALASDFSPVHYRLDAVAGGNAQAIEVTRQDNMYEMKIESGGLSSKRRVNAQPDTVILDNVVPSHFQVLLELLVAKPNARLLLLVPQKLAAMQGRLTVAGDESGTLNGRHVALQKYYLEAGDSLVEIWAEAGDHRLMRILGPMHSVEMVREGFVLDQPLVGSKAPDNFSERLVTFPSGQLTIPATLCLPLKIAAKFPFVVMVGGYGQTDRNETMGPNKPFADIAHGLAAEGIASLRYDKRAFTFRDTMAPASRTIDEEVLDDAVAGVNYAKRLSEADPGEIFLLGHGMGGMMVPIIAERVPVRGEILLASSARPFDQILDQMIPARMRLEGASDEEVELEVARMRRQMARIRSGEARDDERVFYGTVRYWRSLFQLDLPAAIRNGNAPILALDGGKDYLANPSDLDGMAKARGEQACGPISGPYISQPQRFVHAGARRINWSRVCHPQPR